MDSEIREQICSVAGKSAIEDLGWKVNVLSFAVKVTLIKSILFTLPNHIMQLVYILRSVFDDIDKRI